MPDRRGFLRSSAFVLAGVTTGVMTLSACVSLAGRPGFRSVGLGWTVRDLGDDGAQAHFKIAHELTLQIADIDAVYAPGVGGGATGSTRALCRAWIARGEAPTFISGQAMQRLSTPATDFGPIAIQNPHQLAIAADHAPRQDVFYSALLRGWVSAQGAGAAAARAVAAEPALALRAGDHVVFQIDHAGVAGSVAIQAVLGYS